MKPLKVLHIYRTYFPETQGGAQESIRQFCLATQRHGVVNTIFTLAKQPNPSQLDLPEGKLLRTRSLAEIASCDFGGWQAMQLCRKLAREADVLQVHYPWPFADLLLPFIRRTKQPLVITYMSDIVRQGYLEVLYAPLRRYLLGSADAIVATSPNYAATSRVLRQHAHKVRTIPHCLDEAPPPDPGRVRFWRERLGDRFFLFVGVFRYYKGLDFLIQAARLTEAPIVLAGDGPESPRLKKLARICTAKNVHFCGPVSDEDKNALYQLCRAVVFPSHLRSEAFGITLLEGARAGKPLISCEIGTGTSWVNRHLESGLIVPPADLAALADAIQRLAEDDSLCQQLGAGAHQRWKALFTPQAAGEAYRRLYDELLQGL